jgi:threonylcarbamoyladenosine tRNA methylthiotransferase MtaB
MNARKVYVTSKACYIVQTETNHIAAYLKNNGYELVDSCKEAEAIIITTCAVTGKSAEATYQGILECIKGRNDGVPIYVVGCYTRIEPQRVKELEQYGNIFPVAETQEVEREFLGNNTWNSIVYNNFFSHPFCSQQIEQANSCLLFKVKLLNYIFSATDKVLNKETSFYYRFRTGHLYSQEVQRRIWPVVVSKGCTHACSYCAVRIGRGPYRSKALDSVLNEIRAGVANGYKRILLMADELGPYGRDFKDGTSLATLLGLLNSEEFPISLGLWYLDCFHLMEAAPILKELCKKGKIFFMGITVQSESQNILGLMNRRYSVENSLEAIRNLRKYPGVIIATQIMVGFPNETDEDFRKSLDVIKKGYFDLVEVYEYSPRPNTPAAKMTDNVPNHVKIKRAAILRKLASGKGRKLFLRHIIRELRPAKVAAEESKS